MSPSSQSGSSPSWSGDVVRKHLIAGFPGPVVSGSVTFLGTETLEVLRFGPDPTGLVRYATVGVSRRPMHPPTATVLDPIRGPRAELVLSLRPAQDDVLRMLAVLAATPAVEGVVLAAGVMLNPQTPLWPGAEVSAVLLGEPGGPGEPADLELGDGIDPVRFYPVQPITAAEVAKRFTAGRRAPGPAAG